MTSETRDGALKMTVVLSTLSTIEIPGDDASVTDGVLTVFQDGNVSAVFAEGQWVRVEKHPAAVKRAVAPRQENL
jgi:hypothetical protein